MKKAPGVAICAWRTIFCVDTCKIAPCAKPPSAKWLRALDSARRDGLYRTMFI